MPRCFEDQSYFADAKIILRSNPYRKFRDACGFGIFDWFKQFNGGKRIGKTFRHGEVTLLGDYLEVSGTEKITATLTFTAYLGSRGRAP